VADVVAAQFWLPVSILDLLFPFPQLNEAVKLLPRTERV